MIVVATATVTQRGRYNINRRKEHTRFSFSKTIRVFFSNFKSLSQLIFTNILNKRVSVFVTLSDTTDKNEISQTV